MTRVERILNEINDLTPLEKEELMGMLIDFKAIQKQKMVREQKESLKQLIGILSFDDTSTHDEVLAKIKLDSQK